MKRTVWSALALALAATGPIACGEAPEQQPTEPDAPEGISASNGRVMLPAVAGNPGVAYFDVANSGERDRMIRAVSVPDAQGTTLHDTIDGQMSEIFQVSVPAGETLSFAPGGLHVMLDGLAESVAAGGQTEITVTFVGGDKVSFPAEVRAAGDER